MTASVEVDTIIQDIQKSTEKQQELQSLQNEYLGELNKLSEKTTGTSSATYQNDVASVQSRLREVDTKINLENTHYEELMLELALKKKGGAPVNSSAAAVTTTSAVGGSNLDLAAILAGTGTTSAGLPTATTSSSIAGLKGLHRDTSLSESGSIIGGQPQITISQPNGSKDEFNNNDRDQLPNDLARLLRTDDSSSQISKSLPRQETSDTSVDLNIFNDEMRLRNNLENLYKKTAAVDPTTMYSGGETSGLESSFTSPSVHKDFIEQYLNKLSYLPGDVITNSAADPLAGLAGINTLTSAHTQPTFVPTTSYTPALNTTGGGGGLGMTGGLNSMTSINDLFDATSGLYDSGPKVVDMLEIPGKGRCYVYFARYSYEPFQQSLNDNPESELPLTAGDYVIVWGDADEDGYLEGELLDGRKGLIPMNFCERLTGDDLLEFHQSVVLGVTSEEEVWSTMVPTDLPMEMGLTPAAISPAEEPLPYTNPYIEDDHLLNATYYSPEVEENFESTALLGNIVHSESPTSHPHVETAASVVPAPRQLTLERQLNKSILIGWTAPDCPIGQIEMYHVYVDGFLRTTVRATDKTKALVEGVDNARPHRISVRSVTVNRKTSKDAACTMIIGKDAPLGPSCVRASNVTATSSVISWLPSNSNFQHTVCINNVEVRTVKPGTYKHTITGLTPNTCYKVTVRAKNIKASPFVDEKSLVRLLEKLSAHTEFKTLNKALPDPPMDVRVDGGPQDGTILVTWIPVTLNTTTAIRVPITGYAVFADGKRVTDVDSPTSDHALVDLGCIGHFNPKLITVRSKSGDLLSNDSSAVPIQGGTRLKRQSRSDPRGIKYGTHARGGRSISKPRSLRGFRDASGQLVFDPDDENLSDKELYARNIPAIEITRDSAGSEMEPYSDEDFDGGRGRGGRYGGYGGRRRRHHTHGGRDGTRIFVALFDYDPHTMSPNPEACDEELPFREGQLIKIFGDKDADGFYWGECGKKSGYVPCNMVSEVQVEDERMVQEFLKGDDRRGGRGGVGGYPGGGYGGPGGRDRWGDIYANTPVKKMVALYDYDPHELSPNVDLEVELPFRTGDVIYVYGDMDDDGFYLAELRGQRGLVPSNFLSEVPNQGGRPVGAPGAAVGVGVGPRGAGKKVEPAKTTAGGTTPAAGIGSAFSSLFGGKKTEAQPTATTAAVAQQAHAGHPAQAHYGAPGVPGGVAGVGAPGAAVPGVAPAAAAPHLHPPATTAPAPAAAAPASTATGGVNLDFIPGLDDDVGVAAAPAAAPAAGVKPGARPGAAGAAGDKPAEGGLLGGLTGGLTSGISNLTGGAASVTGKLGDVAGGASGAAAGLLKSGGGLFKKFGF